MTTTKANVHDLDSALPTIDRMKIGNRIRRPKRLRADKGYDNVAFRRALRHRHIRSAIDHRDFSHRHRPAQEWDDSGEIRYGRGRWRVEQCFACLDRHRRLDFLYERTREAYEGFLTLAFIRCYLQRLSRCRS